MKLKCLIVEDEPIAQDILKLYIDRTDFFEFSGQLSNAIEAFSFLQNHPVQSFISRHQDAANERD